MQAARPSSVLKVTKAHTDSASPCSACLASMAVLRASSWASTLSTCKQDVKPGRVAARAEVYARWVAA